MAVLERVAVDGLAQGAVPPGYTHTRSTTATYIDSDGLLKVAAINTPRRQWDATNRRWGYVGEPGRTNSLIQTVWPGGGSTPTGWTDLLSTGSRSAVASLLGSADGASAYTFTAAAQRAVFYQSFSLANNTTYVYSVMVESVTGTVSIADVITPSNLPSGCAVTGAFKNGVAASTSDAVSVGVVAVTIGGTYTGASAVFRVGIGCAANATGTVVLSRPQLEAGAYPTSYIPTTTVAVSRGADLLTRALTGPEGTALSTQGTMVVEFGYLGGGSAVHVANRYPISIDNGTTSERVVIYNKSGAHALFIGDGGATQVDNTVAGSVEVGAVTKVAATWKLNDAQISRDGTHGTRDTTATMPTLTNIGIAASSYGTNQGGVIVYGWTIYDDHYPTDAALDALTTPTTNRNQSRLTLGLGLGL